MAQNKSLRRSAIVLLIGAIATLAGLMTATFLERRRCAGSSGNWDDAARVCHLANDVAQGFGARSIVAGLVVGGLALITLYRALLFFEQKR